jgi:nitrogen fixation-related uncharacterized protein
MTPDILFEYIFMSILAVGLAVLALWWIASSFGFFDKDE